MIGMAGAPSRRGLVHDPVGKAKSVMLTEEGEKRSRELFHSILHDLPNKPDAANPAVAPPLQAGRHWRRVADRNVRCHSRTMT